MSYWDHINRDLKYATCAAACTNVANWQVVVVDQVGDVGASTSLVVRDGVRHIPYYDGTNTALKYATCGSGCTSAANWQKVTVDGAGPADVGSGTSIELGVGAASSRIARAEERARPSA